MKTFKEATEHSSELAINSNIPPLDMEDPEKLGMSNERLMRIGPIMEQFIRNNQVPGLLTVVARYGKIVHFEARGYADIEMNIRLQLNTIFRLFSQTKPVTAVAVMVAYEEGLFSLDDPIENYLPEFKNMKVYTAAGLVDAERPITIKHLLTHTAGLDYGWYPNDPVAQLYRDAGLEDANARTSMSTEAYVKKLASLPLHSPPGSQWRYSDAMAVLGRLVEIVSGISFGEFLRDRLFTPLDMVDTDFFVPREKISRLARLYDVGSDGRPAVIDKNSPASYAKHTITYSDYGERPSFESGGAGLVSTAGDYFKFAQMLLNGGIFNKIRILSPTSVKLIMSNHLGPEFGEIPMANLGEYVPEFRRRGLGFGFCGSVVTDAIALGTTGSEGEFSWGGAASTRFWIDPKQNIIGMVFTQLIPDGIYPIGNMLHQMTYQAITG